MEPEKSYYVYLLHCGDGSYYCGYTTDLEARIAAHQAGRGARYTRGRGPLELVYSEVFESRSSALRREAEIKRQRRKEKIALIHESHVR